MAIEPGQIRKDVVAILASIYGGPSALKLISYGPEEDEAFLGESISNFCNMNDSEREIQLAERLKAHMAQEDFTGLAEIHPAWLLEVLTKESPRIIGIILRYLPSKQVRYIIENLPKRIKQRLPQLIDSFAVPAPILGIVRERFERQFISMKEPKNVDACKFENICYLKGTDLEILFKDLGIHELAMALKGVDRRSLNLLLNRLSLDEARSLQQRIRSLSDIGASLLRESKYTVLEMSLTETDPKELLIDIGLNAFARALTERDLEQIPLIKQKLEPRLGYTLRRYIDRHTFSSTDEVGEKRKKIVIERAVALSRAGSIDEGFARYFGVEEHTRAIPLGDTSVQATAGLPLEKEKPLELAD